jgi:hypothetical protein
MRKGSDDLLAEETERLNYLEEMHRLVRYWDFAHSDLFDDLTRELIRSIGTRAYGDCASYWTHLSSHPATNCMIRVARKLSDDF